MLKIEFCLCSVSSFSNALAFTQIDDDDMDYIENNIRTHSANPAQNKQNGDKVHHHSIGNQSIVDFFGKQYVQRAVDFRFERGERKMIKQLVSHVKTIVETEGYDRFKYKLPKLTKKRKGCCFEIDAESPTSIEVLQNEKQTKNSINEKSDVKLKGLLFEKVAACLRQYSVDDHLLETLDDDVVELFEKDGKTYGRIVCVICRNDNAKDLEPKSVSYYESQRSSYWVMSNFTAHLKKHGYEPTKIKKIKRVKKQKSQLANGDIQLNNAEYLDGDQMHRNTDQAESLVGSIHDLSVIIVSEENLVKYDIDRDKLYTQLSKQITEMVTANLTNGDATNQMNFKLNETGDAFSTVTTTKITPDGNCLLGSLVHQIHKYPVTSTNHKNEIKMLRAAICKHILKPENFDYYKHTLETYVLADKKKEAMDMTKECKAYVRNTLAKDGMWAGAEAIHAASDIYAVNVVLFIEDADYYAHSYSTKYKTTIAIAYCKGANHLDQTQYNHYDSVSEIDADIIYNVATALSKPE